MTKTTQQLKHRSFLKWAGGKYSLTEKINDHLPSGTTLVEPFVGAGSVFLNAHFEKYWINDINPDLIGLYQTLKQHPEKLIKACKAMFTAENNQADAYYAIRAQFNATTDTFNRSVMFVYLNRHGYNGLCRYNAKGGFNVPFGRYKAPYFPDNEMRYFAKKLQSAKITCLPFETIFKRARGSQVIYCDPPYVPISKTALFTQYAKNGFSLDDQTELARLAVHATKKQVPVLISNHATDLTTMLYEDAQISTLQVKRSISRDGTKRQPVTEVLALFTPSNLPA